MDRPPPAPLPRRPAVIAPPGAARAACLRSWRRLGLDPVVIPPGDLPVLAERLRQAGATAVTALGDLDARRLAEAPLPADIEAWLPPEKARAALASRSRQVALAHLVGLDVPPTFTVSDDAGLVPKARFPAVARSEDTAGAPAVLLPDRTALAALLSGRPPTPPLLVQPLVTGPRTVLHGCRSRSGRVFALEAFAVPHPLRGRPYALRHAVLPPAVVAQCAALAEEAGLVGCFRVTFRGGGGRPCFLGLEGGIGDTALLALRIGYDAPRHLLEAYGAVPRKSSADTLSARTVFDLRAALGHWRRQLLASAGTAPSATSAWSATSAASSRWDRRYL